MFDMEGIDSLLDGGATAPPKLGYYLELTLRCRWISPHAPQ